MQVDPIDGDLVNRRLRLRKPAEQRRGPLPCRGRQRRPPDVPLDVGEAVMAGRVGYVRRMLMIVAGVVVRVNVPSTGLRAGRDCACARGADSVSRNLVAEMPPRRTRSADSVPYSIARLPTASRSASSGRPRSSRAPRNMSPAAPEKQSMYSVLPTLRAFPSPGN